MQRKAKRSSQAKSVRSVPDTLNLALAAALAGSVLSAMGTLLAQQTTVEGRRQMDGRNRASAAGTLVPHNVTGRFGTRTVGGYFAPSREGNLFDNSAITDSSGAFLGVDGSAENSRFGGDIPGEGGISQDDDERNSLLYLRTLRNRANAQAAEGLASPQQRSAVPYKEEYVNSGQLLQDAREQARQTAHQNQEQAAFPGQSVGIAQNATGTGSQSTQAGTAPAGWNAEADGGTNGVNGEYAGQHAFDSGAPRNVQGEQIWMRGSSSRKHNPATGGRYGIQGSPAIGADEIDPAWFRDNPYLGELIRAERNADQGGVPDETELSRGGAYSGSDGAGSFGGSTVIGGASVMGGLEQDEERGTGRPSDALAKNGRQILPERAQPVQERLEGELLKSPLVNPLSPIQVTLEGGRAIVQGIVPNNESRVEAGRILLSDPRVESVDNRLTVLSDDAEKLPNPFDPNLGNGRQADQPGQGEQTRSETAESGAGE